MFNVKDALSLPQALAAILQSLEGLRAEVRGLRRSDPPARNPEDPEPQWIVLSSLDPETKTQRQIPTEFHLTGLMIGSDTPGRCTLQIGTVQYPFYVPANQTGYFPFSMEDRRVIRNDAVSFNKVTGSTNWDVILIGHPRGAQMQGATQRA